MPPRPTGDPSLAVPAKTRASAPRGKLFPPFGATDTDGNEVDVEGHLQAEAERRTEEESKAALLFQGVDGGASGASFGEASWNILGDNPRFLSKDTLLDPMAVHKQKVLSLSLPPSLSPSLPVSLSLSPSPSLPHSLSRSLYLSLTHNPSLERCGCSSEMGPCAIDSEETSVRLIFVARIGHRPPPPPNSKP